MCIYDRTEYKSNGFQLESSLIRSADALHRLCFVLAITNLYLVSQGTGVVEQSIRRAIDPHWFRGNSYLKLGWKWVPYALSKGLDLTLQIEHAIGGVKRYRIVKDKIRAWKNSFRDRAMEACCGLHNFRLKFRPWHYAPISLKSL